MIHCFAQLTDFRGIENDVPRDFGVSFVYTAGGLKRDIPRPGQSAAVFVPSEMGKKDLHEAEVARDVTKDREQSLDVD